MLSRLHIRDFAIVDALELDLGPGMTVLTGETGAGKSILVDALGLALGDRADASVVRAGAERAEITAVFDVREIPAARAWLAERDLAGDDECLLRRVVGRDGRSRGFVNGSPAPLQSLQQLAGHLVDIHGQHAHQSLLHRGQQRDLLDAYAGHRALVGTVADAFQAWRAVEAEHAASAAAAAERASRLDLVQYLVGELDGLGLAEGEVPALEEEQRRLANAGRLQEEASRLVGLLYEDDQSLEAGLARAASALDGLSRLDGRLQGARGLLEGALIQLKETAGSLRDYLQDVDLDPARLEAVDRRLAAIHDLARKHRVRPDALPERRRELENELALLRGTEVMLAGLEAEAARLRGLYLDASRRLGAQRRKAAPSLAAAVTERLKSLGMGGASFCVAVEAVDEGQAGAYGLDRIEFLVSTNPGQPPAPLAKIASGGELSRISLAIQVAAAGLTAIPTLVFDEVDVGIGGGIAEIVGRLLRGLGQRRQVLCVTHLPQVASQGDHHLLVEKAASAEGVRTEIRAITGGERVQEIARMAGGVEITPQTLAHAKDMIRRGRPSG
jgi:DNA repair protein RecN (Recombination protein N)